MNEEINRIRWKCRRGMREIDLLLREFSITKLETLNEDELSTFSDIIQAEAFVVLRLLKYFLLSIKVILPSLAF